MDTVTNEKKPKQAGKTNGYATLRVKKDTRKRVVSEIKKLNNKPYGRKIRLDDFVSFALGLITSEHHHQLQEATLSNQDRLNRDYEAYVAKNGMISKDEYLGKRLNGELPATQHTQNEVTPERSITRQ